MKKITLVALIIFLSGILNAQDKITGIRQGDMLEYTVIPPNAIPLQASLSIELLAADSVMIKWQTGNYNGRRGMLKNSIEKGNYGYWEPPMNGEDIIIPEQQTMLCISRSLFSELKQKGKMEFDGQVLELINTYEPIVYPVNGKQINAIRAENESGTTRIWISDNAFFPLILKLEGNPYQVDVELVDIR